MNLRSRTALAHHSLTLPAMSNVPYGPIPRYSPARAGPLPLKLLHSRIAEWMPIAAASRQWCTVGSDLPANCAYAAASYQLTPRTGQSSWPSGYVPSSQVEGPGRPVVSRSSATASSHATVRAWVVIDGGQYRASR